MATNQLMLQASELTKSFGDLRVLRGINLDIQKSEIVSIVGSSGAGKSTLLHLLGTLDRPDTGEVQIDGQPVFKLSTNDLATFRNQRIGFVFQFHNLLPEFSTFENICMPAYIAQRSTSELEERATHLMRLLGIYERKEHKPSQLSGGEQQRAAVARALINDPAIVFADEPSGNLDSKNAAELHELFFSLRSEFEQTFVIVTHNNDLATMADRQVEIKDGLLV